MNDSSKTHIILHFLNVFYFVNIIKNIIYGFCIIITIAYQNLL